MGALWRCGARAFEAGRKTLVMGILNVTPDSFSDGGRFREVRFAVEHALRLADEGADIIDIGGESSRPGARAVEVREELARVIPAIRAIRARRPELCLSIDTVKAEVAQAALEEGVQIVNDISGLAGDPEMPGLLSGHTAGCVIMHMKGTPRTMQRHPGYADVVGEVAAFFRKRLREAEEAGIERERICLDPGIGFGKTTAHNLEILRRLEEFLALGRPLLVGPSRKSFIGEVLNVDVGRRLEGTLAACLAGVFRGASVVRVHDVLAVRRAVDLADAIRTGAGTAAK